MNAKVFKYKFSLILLLIITLASFARADDLFYYRNFVHHADGSSATHEPPNATFTAFLNNDLSKVLIENAPRWDQPDAANIDGSGTFGVEFGNFTDPQVQAGDSIFIRFTCNVTQEQGVLNDSVPSIPWTRFPQILTLEPMNLPAPPANVQLQFDEANRRIVSWDPEGGMTYTVYRRTFQDTLPSGNSRKLYTQMAFNHTNGQFVDSTTTTDSTFAYIIYAKNGDGIWSSHSAEAVSSTQITGLSITPRATTTILTWDAITPPIGETKGYNIYRRKSGESFGNPIGYCGVEPKYVDSRLNMNTEYFYKIKARTSSTDEFGESDEVSTTTLASQDGFYPYANLKIAVVVYQNTNAGDISDETLAKIKQMINVSKKFYWRNSRMHLNVELTYYPITEHRTFNDPDNLAINQTINELISKGVVNTQYDIIFRVTPATNGYWSIGVSNLGFPGPTRKTGFSQTEWPVGTGVVYPGHQDGLDYGLTWVFIHEVEHAIDALYNANGFPEMAHGDLPENFPVSCGEHLDFQAKIFRTFDNYLNLLPEWGEIYEAVDADNDGFSDSDSLLMIDEARFGSSNQSADTDQDGYTDRQEALDGDYSGSNPNLADTDRDSTLDGDDQFPRYPIRTTGVPEFTPQIDGVLEDGWTMINDSVSYTQQGYSPQLYLAYTSDSLYLALNLPKIGIPRFTWDFDADGWWHSRGNTKMEINLSQGTFSEFRSRDASQEARDLTENNVGMWDDNSAYVQHFGRRVMDPESVHFVVNLDHLPRIVIEMAIAKDKFAGLTLQPGDSIGLNINYSKVNNDWNQWATTFDQYSFVDFQLAEGSNSSAESSTPPVASTYELQQNYPNPFNNQTIIQYSLPKQSRVKMVVFDLTGRRIRTVVDEVEQAGNYSTIWNGTNSQGEIVSSGVYFYRLIVDNRIVSTNKMVFMQ